MTDDHRKKFKKAAKAILKKVTSSKKAARKFLVEVGIITKKGNFRKPFKNLKIS